MLSHTKEALHFIRKSISQTLEEAWRCIESKPPEVCTVSDGLGCRAICWCWSTVFYQVQTQHSHLPEAFRALHAADKLL